MSSTLHVTHFGYQILKGVLWYCSNETIRRSVKNFCSIFSLFEWRLFQLFNIFMRFSQYCHGPVRYAYPLQLAQDRWTQPWERACRPQSLRRRCWTSHLHLRWSCHLASDHQAGFHAPDSRVPSRHYRSGHLLVLHGWRYTHAARGRGEKQFNIKLFIYRAALCSMSNSGSSVKVACWMLLGILIRLASNFWWPLQTLGLFNELLLSPALRFW